MILHEVKEKFFRSIDDELISNGFKLVKSKNWYEKKQADCKLILFFQFHKRSEEIAIEAFCYIQHLETEKVYKTATKHAMSHTIGNEIGKLINNQGQGIQDHSSYELIIETDTDIANASNEIIRLYEAFIKSYFKENSNLNRIDSILNDFPDQINVHSNEQFFRCPKGLIVAKLNGRENFQELEYKYDIKMAKVADLFKSRYEAVKEYLSPI